MSTYADRLKALREQLKAERLDGFVVPLTDEHMSEYVGSYAQRLAWLTGFQGSAGSAVVLPEEAAIFVDGRYTLQVRQQVSADQWSYQSVPDSSAADWLKDHAPQGARIGYDPWLHTSDWVKKAREALASRGAELVPVAQTPIDIVWKDRPEASTADLSVASENAGPEVRQHLGNGVRLHERSEFESALADLKGHTVAVDPERAVAAIFDALERAGAAIVTLRDPTILPKAIKNPAEIAGQKAAQERDGAAISKFLHWVETEAPGGRLDELTASDKLESLRHKNPEIRDLSFDTISGAGPNGAIVHYKSSEKPNRKQESGTLYLVDPGWQ